MEKEDLAEFTDLVRELIDEVRELRSEAQGQSASLENTVDWLEKIDGRLESA